MSPKLKLTIVMTLAWGWLCGMADILVGRSIIETLFVIVPSALIGWSLGKDDT